MGTTCVGVSRKTFQPYRKIQREHKGSQSLARIDNYKESKLTVETPNQVANNTGNESPIKQAYSNSNNRSFRSPNISAFRSDNKENNVDALSTFMQQKSQSPIQTEVSRQRACTIHTKIARRYFQSRVI